MEDFLFVTDFDGTLTQRDFYEMVIDRFIPEEGRRIRDSWRKGDMTVFGFLKSIFQSINRSEAEVETAVADIAVDPDINSFFSRIREAGGEFLVLSAGTRYYIEKALHGKGIKEPWIIANPGYYGNGGVIMTADTDSPFYSETYGIDKSLVVKKYKQQYHKVFYAGDSEPDFKAALLADVVFARGQLARLLEAQGHPFIPFTSFQEIAAYLERTGVLSR